MRYQYSKSKLIKCRNCGKEFPVKSSHRKVCTDCKDKRKREYSVVHKEHAKIIAKKLRIARKKRKSNSPEY